ncbi:hypothetical protein [Dysgonomonas sp. 520]|uniref:hypothetical protein n=1 Tax=Dysgonomonas sp. 520 TaxID=2302931 RepID=UPI0013D0AD3F|nr:hypothetical protein [Dysgonomonas sp. 520]NDW11065.1 hypothetical protein [Dysgonomonas sp. 520]
MKNKLGLSFATLFCSLCVFAQGAEGGQSNEIIKVGSNNTFVFVTLAVVGAILLAGLAVVYILLSKKYDKLRYKLSQLEKEVDDNDLSSDIKKLKTQIKVLEEKLEGLHLLPQPISRPKEEKKDEETERIIEQPKEKSEAKKEIFFANYRPQDKCFNLSSTENDGWMIWEIEKLSSTQALYKLADVQPSVYGEQWAKIKDIVKCAVAPSGTIIAARTKKSGKLLNKGGEWVIDPDNIVEIEFVCE